MMERWKDIPEGVHETLDKVVYMSPKRGFETAATFLQEHSGIETQITAGYMEKSSELACC